MTAALLCYGYKQIAVVPEKHCLNIDAFSADAYSRPAARNLHYPHYHPPRVIIAHAHAFEIKQKIIHILMAKSNQHPVLAQPANRQTKHLSSQTIYLHNMR